MALHEMKYSDVFNEIVFYYVVVYYSEQHQKLTSNNF